MSVQVWFEVWWLHPYELFEVQLEAMRVLPGGREGVDDADSLLPVEVASLDLIYRNRVSDRP
jgi:hypothetical protein